ncbi:ketose-bisphosphate aldolase [Fusobacterium varium]|uniref:ketose-bisphosphate aldolase n=1 Tax=Fusobacterium varium TaxID=856 RepID=UPI00356ACDE9
MSYNYRELGLVNTKEMFKKANENGYAVPAFNFNNLEQVLAIVEACAETGSPVILQCSKEVIDYIGITMIPLIAKGAVDYIKSLGAEIPVALHLDHGSNFEIVKKCIDIGFSSVMFDGSHYPFDENIAKTKKIVEYAHSKDISAEAELGVLAGIEEGKKVEKHEFTNPDEVESFIKQTGVDSLAIAIGTSHGTHKFKPGDDPKLKLDVLLEIERRMPGFPIVLHGSSEVPRQYIEMIKQHGGMIKDAIGIPNIELRKVTKSAVAKINVSTDGSLAFTGALRKFLMEKPEEFDLKKYLGAAREEMKKYYKIKIIDVFGSDGAYKKATII